MGRHSKPSPAVAPLPRHCCRPRGSARGSGGLFSAEPPSTAQPADQRGSSAGAATAGGAGGGLPAAAARPCSRAKLRKLGSCTLASASSQGGLAAGAAASAGTAAVGPPSAVASRSAATSATAAEQACACCAMARASAAARACTTEAGTAATWEAGLSWRGGCRRPAAARSAAPLLLLPPWPDRKEDSCSCRDEISVPVCATKSFSSAGRGGHN